MLQPLKITLVICYTVLALSVAGMDMKITMWKIIH